MKRVMMILLLVMCCQLYSQTVAEKNEFKLDLAYILAPALKVEYERLLSDGTTLGAAGLYHFDDDYNIKYQILGFYRWYFGKEPISGFFLEANMGISGGYYESWFSYALDGSKEESEESYSALGAGIALGWKFVTNTGVVLDIFSGIGRMVGDVGPEVYPRWGVCIGKRF